MTIGEDISANASQTFRSNWTTRDGTVVPVPTDLKLGNDAVHLKSAAVLYADLDQSTLLVESREWWFAGEVYKTFLHAASRIIRRHGGSIVSYDGDRVMGIFIADRPCNSAVSCALELHYAVRSIVQGEMDKHYKERTKGYKVKHVVGIDTSPVRAARTGVRGDNDLVWIGNAPNLAAKLTALNSDQPTWITKRVYDVLDGPQKTSNGTDIWKRWTWTQHNNDPVYSSTYWRIIA